jgi:hypothetical protein
VKNAAAGGSVVFLGVLAAMLSGASMLDQRRALSTSLDGYAVEYLTLAADLDALDPASVDFLIGGPDKELPRSMPTFASIAKRSLTLAAQVRAAGDNSSDDADDAARARALARQLGALAFRSDLQTGMRVSFSDELDRLFAIDLSSVSERSDNGDAARDALAQRLPGTGPISRRLSQYQRRFVVSRAHLHAVITRSIAECREQTKRFVTLPTGEELGIEYVADVPWSGYSVYRGNYKSVMQVNRAMPLSIGQALNLACHEGYPGHHTHNSLRDQHLVKEGNRPEARTLLTFSPDGFQAEALVAAGAAMAFSLDERSRLFREVLFPIAGLDPGEDTYAEISELIDRLTGNTAPTLRGYLSGELSAAEAATALERNALMEHPEGLLAYVDRYRGYTLAYTWGRDRLLSKLTAPTLAAEDRWRMLHRFMTSPQDQDDLFSTTPLSPPRSEAARLPQTGARSR